MSVFFIIVEKIKNGKKVLTSEAMQYSSNEFRKKVEDDWKSFKINPKDYWLEVLEKFPLDGTEERKLRHLMISKELQNIS